MDRLDREDELLEQIKSAPGDANFVLAQRRAFEEAAKGRKMTLRGLCVSSIIQNRAVFAAQPNSFSGLSGSLVQLLFDQTMAHFEGLAWTFEIPLLEWSALRGTYVISHKEWHREIRVFEQFLQTGRVTQLHMDADRTFKTEFARWLISAAVVHCPQLDRLCLNTEFCLSLDGLCVLDHTISQLEQLHNNFPLERLQHLTRLTLRLEGTHKGGHKGAAGLVRIVEALPVLKYLDCSKLYQKPSLAAAFVALVQPLLQQNQRELEVKSMTLELPDLQVDLSTNLRVRKFQLLEVHSGDLSRLRHLSGVRALLLGPSNLQSCYSLVELLGPRGLKILVLWISSSGRELVDLLRVFAAAPDLSYLQVVIDVDEFPPDENESPTEEQLGAINFERMKCVSVQGYRSVSLSNHFLPYLEQFVLRAESAKELILKQPEQNELVLRMLKEHPECCTRVRKLSLAFQDEVDEDAAVEVATRIALRSPTLIQIEVVSIVGERHSDEMVERLKRQFPWFISFLTSNGICLSYQRPLTEEW